MVKILKRVFLICGLSLFILFLVVDLAGPYAKVQAQQVKQVGGPLTNSTVLVEAFVVDVDLSALYAMDVSPISEGPNSVTVEKILEYMHNRDKASVIAGAKVAVQNEFHSSTEDSQIIYLESALAGDLSDSEQTSASSSCGPRESSVEPKSESFAKYKIGKKFEAWAGVISDDQVSVKYNYEQTLIKPGMSKKDMPTDTIHWSWSGVVCLKAGRPSIVGAVQNEKRAAFLIIVADIRDS